MYEVKKKTGEIVKGYCECDEGHEWKYDLVQECFDKSEFENTPGKCKECGLYPWFYPNEEPKNIETQDQKEPKMLVQYIVRNRNKQKQKVGCLVGICEDGEIGIGWSLCGPEDKFDKHRAKQMAIGRASKFYPLYNHSYIVLFLPPSIVDEASNFYERCKRYFKEASYETGE